MQTIYALAEVSLFNEPHIRKRPATMTAAFKEANIFEVLQLHTLIAKQANELHCMYYTSR